MYVCMYVCMYALLTTETSSVCMYVIFFPCAIIAGQVIDTKHAFNQQRRNAHGAYVCMYILYVYTVCMYVQIIPSSVSVCMWLWYGVYA